MDVNALVTAVPPTNAPRNVHLLIASVSSTALGQLTTRPLHQVSALVNGLVSFSNAHWLTAKLKFVPRTSAYGHSTMITVALHGASRIPVDVNDLQALGTCVHLSSGGDTQLPAIHVYTCDFEPNFISPLIKPAPIQLPLPAVSFSISTYGTIEDGVVETLFDVFLVGSVATGGAA
jgi:hypothetical protein